VVQEPYSSEEHYIVPSENGLEGLKHVVVMKKRTKHKRFCVDGTTHLLLFVVFDFIKFADALVKLFSKASHLCTCKLKQTCK
jgi:hypothetical protein